MRRRLLIVLVLPLVLLTACRQAEDADRTAPVEQAPQADTGNDELLRLRGSFFYLPRIALPPDSELTVELRAGAAPQGPVLAELHVELGGRQVPLDFEIAVASDRLQAGATHTVRGVIASPGSTLWTSEPVVVEAETLPECAPAEDANSTFRARGNEPGWHLEIGAETLVLVLDYGASRLATATPPAMAADDGGRVYAVQEGTRETTAGASDSSRRHAAGAPYRPPVRPPGPLV